jgi:transposase
MEVLFERVAGLDVGKSSVTVCVRTPGVRRGRHTETRTFKTTTGSLRLMRDWLLESGVTIAAMESTSTYWKPPFYCLEEVMEVWLLNAAHMKAVPGRKTDVRDAEWIAQLLEHGLLRPSFVPPPDIRRLRMLTRYRVQLMGDRTRETIRLELMLEDASIKLSAVASSVTTVSARAMLAAMIDGERDPLALADLAKGKMRRKLPELAQALDGHFDEHHARLAGSILRRLDLVEQAQAELDEVIRAACQPWARQIGLLQTIPGVGEKVAQVIVAETGADMTRFPTAAHLCSWAGLAPAMYESAGKRTPAGRRAGNKWLTAMLVEAAGAVGRMHGKNYLAAQHARLTRRRGMGRAQVAVAHSMLTAAYYMLLRDEPYQDLGADWLAKRNDEAHTRRLVAQLERLGHTVVIDPAA